MVARSSCCPQDAHRLRSESAAVGGGLRSMDEVEDDACDASVEPSPTPGAGEDDGPGAILVVACGRRTCTSG